jgi:hypothetical protein
VDALTPELAVTVAGGKFVVDGTSQQATNLSPSLTYRFDQSDSSNATHPLKFSTTADGTHASGTEFTTGVTVVGTAGTANAYTQIVVEQDSPAIYYYCANHASMGGVAYNALALPTADGTEGQMLVTDGAGNISFADVAVAGGDLVQIGAKDTVGTYEPGWDENNNYSRVYQFDKGQFAVLSHTFNDNNGGGLLKNRLRVAPFTVDQSTGAMVWGTRANAFLNNYGYVHSTQSFGRSGKFGLNWGHSAWGSNTSHYNGGCCFKIENNTLIGSSNTGNTTYAGENTSNGNLALYPYSSSVGYHIPNGYYTSYGRMAQSNGTNQSWPSASMTNYNSTSAYVWRCIGNDSVGRHGKSGLVSVTGQLGNLYNTTSSGRRGYVTVSGYTSNGLGFELASGVQLYFSQIGSYYLTSDSATAPIAATVTKVGASGGVDTVPGAAHDLGLIGMTFNGLSKYTGGSAAVEVDTFYVLSGFNPCKLIKFKIVNPSGGTFTLEVLGTVDLTPIVGSHNVMQYANLVDVTGADDDFILISARGGSYQPSHTMVIQNPLKDL